MKIRHDPLAPKPRQKKARETPDETERRLNADLRLLMNDKRYQDNDDRDFRHFVQRQFRRVYDDPSGEPKKTLRVGRPETFVTDLEPFDRTREQRLRRGEEAKESEGAKLRQSRKPGGSLIAVGQTRQGQSITDSNDFASEEHDIIPPDERAAGQLDPGDPGRGGPTPGIFGSRNEEVLERYLEVAEARTRSNIFMTIASNAGWEEAVRAHKHYIRGSGRPLVVDAAVVRDYEPVMNAQHVILSHLSDWFDGKQTDSRFGRPWLDLSDGETITIGEESFDADRVGGLVRWVTTFEGPVSKLDPAWRTDARMTFNSGTLESFSQLTLERHGDRIEISGYVKLRVADRYDFKKDHILNSRVLEDRGGAKSFDISTSFWVRPISGWMDISGSPVTSSHLTFDD